MESMEASCSPTKRCKESDSPINDCAMDEEALQQPTEDDTCSDQQPNESLNQCEGNNSDCELTDKPEVIDRNNDNHENSMESDDASVVRMQTESNDCDDAEAEVTNDPIVQEQEVECECEVDPVEEPKIPKLMVTRNKNASPAKKTNNRTKQKSAEQKFVCPICDLEKQYKQPKKTYGVLCCAACPGYFRSFLNNPEQFYCELEGQCDTRDRRSEQACRACWLRACLQHFQLEPAVREFIMCNYPPRLESSTQIIDFEIVQITTMTTTDHLDRKAEVIENSRGRATSMTTTSTNSTLASSQLNSAGTSNASSSSSSPSRTSSLSLSSFSFSQSASYYYNNSYSSYNGYGNRGPRVKRVCRSIEDVYRGLPRAMFPVCPTDKDTDSKDVKDTKANTKSKTPVKGRNGSQRSSPTKKSPTKSSSKKVNKRKSTTGTPATSVSATNDDDEYDSDDLPITEYIYRNLEKEMRASASYDQD